LRDGGEILILGHAAEARPPIAFGRHTSRSTSNSHDTDTVAGPIFSSVYPDVVQSNLIDTDDLVDDASAGETLPRAGSIGSPTASPVAQLNRKHEVVAAMTVHITSMSLEVHSYDRRRAAHC
jgi:hypothetical protein